MKIGVVGLGYIGLVTAAVLAENGNIVVGIDVDKDRITELKNGGVPFYEPGLKEALEINNQNMIYSTDFAVLSGSDATFVCVPTPNKKGEIDLSYVERATARILESSPKSRIIIKSTVIPGTARKLELKFGTQIISNPEFTKEGSAMSDTRTPDRIIIGGNSAEIAEKIWGFSGSPIIRTSNENAELIKYASNAFLATKISFINELADLCENIPGADVDIVSRGMGLDRRIGLDYLKAGIGYGGSCFPKDTVAISSYAKKIGVELGIVDKVIEVNDKRVDHIVSILKKIQLDLKHMNICILGMAFKENTDDLRESKSVDLTLKLIHEGAKVKVYDPKVKCPIEGAFATSTLEECISGVEGIIIATEWDEFKKIESVLTDAVILDARRILSPQSVRNYVGVGFNDTES